MTVVRVDGLRELERAFRACGGDLKRQLNSELNAVGNIVRDDERAYLSGIGASSKSIGGIRTRLRGSTVAVEQRYPTITGQRGDWGARIMSSLVTARAKRRPDTERRLEQMLGNIGRRNGF